jgi:antitoxin component YwqK of YwqJK toxin-antitoxin module
MKSNRKLLLVLLLITAILFLFSIKNLQAQKNQKTFKDKDLHCEYNLNSGMLNGSYKSYFENGKHKSSGSFYNNNWSGLWTLWDSTGKIMIKRDYKSNFEYKQLYPSNINNYTYLNKRDTSGYIKDFDVKEEMIVQSQRNWRLIEKNNNDLLFKNNYLGKVLTDLVLKSKTSAYNGINDEFTKPYSIKEITDKYDFNKIEIIAYKIKETWFFDNVRKISESRIIGICPVAVYKSDTSMQFDLFWLYYPDIRVNLAKEKINHAMPNIKNLDDVFFFRYFSSKIYKEDNIYNKEIKDYKNGNEIDVEAERIMLNLIETETDFWKKFASEK